MRYYDQEKKKKPPTQLWGHCQLKRTLYLSRAEAETRASQEEQKIHQLLSAGDNKIIKRR